MVEYSFRRFSTSHLYCAGARPYAEKNTWQDGSALSFSGRASG